MPHILIDPRQRHEAGFGRLGDDALTSRPSPSAIVGGPVTDAGSQIFHPKITILRKHNQENLNHSKPTTDTLKPAFPPVGSFCPPRARSSRVFRSKNIKPASKPLSRPRSILDQVHAPGSDGVRDKSVSSPSPVSPSISSLSVGDVAEIDDDIQRPKPLVLERASALSTVHSPHIGLKKTSNGVSGRRASALDQLNPRVPSGQFSKKKKKKKKSSSGRTSMAMAADMCGGALT